MRQKAIEQFEPAEKIFETLSCDHEVRVLFPNIPLSDGQGGLELGIVDSLHPLAAFLALACETRSVLQLNRNTARILRT